VRRWQLAGEIRAASTAYGLRTPLVFAPVKAANACGAQPVFSAVATVALLAARSPKLDTALRAAKQAGHAFVVMDGTLIPIDRVAADRPFYSGKHRKHGMNLQVIASPHGDIVWISGALPGSVHDLTAARIWSIVPRLAAAGLIVLAVRPGPRCGQRSVPGGLGAGAHGGPL
jgi:hypothetical protein